MEVAAGLGGGGGGACGKGCCGCVSPGIAS